MAHSITNSYNPKRPKMPHRRATIDSPIGASSSRPSIKPKRRLTLPLRKSVQFSHLSEVCVLENQEEKTKIWYTGEDHQRFKRERISDVVNFRAQSRQKMPAGGGPSNPSSPGPFCPIGIEQLLSTKGMVEACSSRKNVIQQVLLEQHRQRIYGFRDPDLIAIVSVKLSSNALDASMKRGKFQEMAKFI